MKPVDVKLSTYIESGKKLTKKILNLMMVTMSEYQNTKKFCKGYVPHRSEEVFVIKKVKNTVPLTYY